LFIRPLVLDRFLNLTESGANLKGGRLDRLLIQIFCVFFATLPCFGQSGKLEAVQSTVKEKCNLTLSQSESLKLVKSLFLVCVPGTVVDVSASCHIKCLKENSGVILGQ
jgi:hypothetical protein